MQAEHGLRPLGRVPKMDLVSPCLSSKALECTFAVDADFVVAAVVVVVVVVVGVERGSLSCYLF